MTLVADALTPTSIRNRVMIGIDRFSHLKLNAMVPTEISKDERNFAMFAHLSSLVGFVVPFGNLIAPLVIWQLKKEDMPFAADQAKECLNFQLSLVIYLFVSAILVLLFIGVFLMLGLLVANVVLTILAAIKANDGIAYRYPYIIRFIK